VEMSPSMSPPDFAPVSSVLTTNTFTVTNCPSPAYFRLRLTAP
jgi:surface antigen